MNAHVKTIISILSVSLITTSAYYFPTIGKIMSMTLVFALVYFLIYLFWSESQDDNVY